MVVAFSSRRIKVAAFFFAALLFVIHFASFDHSNRPVIWRQPRFHFNGSRKPLEQAGNETALTMMKKKEQLNRVSDSCCPEDIVICQAATSPLPNGIPTYTVHILNECMANNCRIGSIHLACGWFSSARLVNPRIFRRLKHDDCLVNDGRPIAGGQSISFQYANSFPYTLSLSSATCL